MVFSKEASRDRRIVLAALAAALVVTGITDTILLGGLSIPLLSVRVVWAGLFLGIAWVMPRLGPETLEWTIAGAALGAGIGWTLLSGLSGGSLSPYFYLMPALPLAFGVLAPDNLRSTLTATASMFAGTLAILVREGAGWGSIAIALVNGALLSSLAIVGASTYRRLRASELAVGRAHERAIEDLAISESRRLKAEKLALIGRLSSRIAHELNNPLAFVKSNLDFLDTAHNCSCHEQLVPVLEDSRFGIDRIEKIVSALDSFARMDDAKTETCELAGLVDEATKISMLRTRSVARVLVDVPADLPHVEANAAQLVQVIVILLLNAADSIAESRTASGSIEIQARAERGQVALTVSNDGPGIPPEIRAFIFEPFFTTKAVGKGAGLGLALAREFLQRFSASITLEDRRDAGVRFRVTLPAAATPAAAAEIEAFDAAEPAAA